jgi:hypothetical protein
MAHSALNKIAPERTMLVVHVQGAAEKNPTLACFLYFWPSITHPFYYYVILVFLRNTTTQRRQKTVLFFKNGHFHL